MAKKATNMPMRGSKGSKLIEEKKIGYETVDWSSVEMFDYQSKILDTLRHYGYFYDIKDSFSWAAEWVKANKSKQDLKFFKASSDRLFSMTAGGLCRMIMNGAVLPETSLNLVERYIDKAIADGKASIEGADNVSIVDIPRRTPADIVKERTSDFIACIEEMLDMFDGEVWMDWENYSVYNELQKGDLPYNTAKGVVDYYTPLCDELTELVDKKTDDLVEAYSHLGVRKRKQLLNVVQGVISDAEKYMTSKKAIRKPRKKKVTSAGQQVSKVQYLKESAEFKLASIDPINLVGANEVYLFNTKYRYIIHLVSSSKSGFQVKGTTIQNIDIDMSTRKTIRKPDEFFTEFNKATKAKRKKILNDIKAKPAEPKGRLNDQTLILKVF